jgi:prephenate dehydratase
MTPSRPDRPRIAFQGIAGAFSELAVQHWWPDALAVGYPTFTAALDAVIDSSCEAGVIPVHNRIAGPVEAALAALQVAHSSIVLTAESEVPVELCLLAHAAFVHGTPVREVLSHPMALAQCRPFLDALGATVTVHEDTAGAARDVAHGGDPARVAIASARAAEAYGLVILERGIQAEADNRTRFVRVERPAASR